MASNAKSTKVLRSEITVDSVTKAQYQKEGTLTAQLRQLVTTESTYQSKKVDSDMQQNIFEAEADFGFKDKEYESKETRIAWLLIPATMTLEQVTAAMVKHNQNGATIYKVLSNRPVLDENQEYSIRSKQKTLDDYANSQVVRYSEGTTVNGVDVSGQLILDNNGNPQYRRTFFWRTPQDDKDTRNPNDVYMSPEIKAELVGASAVGEGQTI